MAQGAYPPPPPPGSGGEIDRLRAQVAQYFPVYETRVTPNSLLLLVHADPTTLEERFDRLRRELWTQSYVPQVRYEGGEYVIEVIRRPNRRTWGSSVNLALLLLTIVTTVFAGAFLWLSYVGGSSLSPVDFLWGGLAFALPLMGILGIHELAHYGMARRHHVEASLPFFLPVPPPYLLFGTFGAFISLREPIPSKKALLDIGASGPLAGFAVAIPVTIFGLFLSNGAPVLSVANCGPTILGMNYGNLLIGLPPIWSILSLFVPVSSQNLSPVAFAGWVGILVTAINLIPAGQLDGGHVARALLGERSRYASWGALLLLFGLGFFYPGWFIFAILIFVLGMRHPPPLNDITPLDGKRIAVGAVALLVLVGGFAVVPISTASGQFSVTNVGSGTIAVPPGYSMADSVSFTVINHDAVDHGFLFSANITSVVIVVNGKPVNLPSQDPALFRQFEANSTWAVTFPNGNHSVYPGVGAWATADAQYSKLAANGGRGVLTFVFLNRESGLVNLSVTVSQVCAVNGPAPQTLKFSVD
jgi:membrane-associated protease RseP (regulator of RpoE activity)